MTKSTDGGSKQPHKLSYGQKVKLFFRRDILAIIGSAIALYTWYQEKVTLEEHRFKLSDHFRIESTINTMLFGHRILQLQTNQTLATKYLFGADTGAYRVAFSTNVVNEVQQEIEIIFLMRIQNDVDDDSVAQIKAEKITKFNQCQKALATGNFDSLYKYENEQTLDFSAEVTKLNNASQPALNKINERLHQQQNRYLILYLLAALFLTLDRIRKVKLKES